MSPRAHAWRAVACFWHSFWRAAASTGGLIVKFHGVLRGLASAGLASAVLVSAVGVSAAGLSAAGLSSAAAASSPEGAAKAAARPGPERKFDAGQLDPGELGPRERAVAQALRRVSAPERLVVQLRSLAARPDVLRLAQTARASEADASRGRTLVLDLPRGRSAGVRATLASRPDVVSVLPAHRRSFSMVPNDSSYAGQSAYLEAVRAPQAWDVTQGSRSVKIAVIDSGADIGHRDLAGKVVGRYNAVDGTTNVTDAVGHGTAVASIAAGATNDGFGIAGAGFNSSLLIVKVADSSGEPWSDAVARGIRWAVDAGASVINLSLGGPQLDKLEASAIAYALAKGVVVVAAAGNEGTSTVQYPAAAPGVIAVGSTSSDGVMRSMFSSYGAWVDVAAPGEQILGAVVGGGVAPMSGTSFAAPLVSGEVALLRARTPSAGMPIVRATVSATTGAASLGFARGLVNFSSALSRLTLDSAPTFASPATGATVAGTVDVAVTSTARKVQVSAPGYRAELPVVDGTALARVPTYGLVGAFTVRAMDCASGFCSTRFTDLPLVAGNPSPVLTAPAAGAQITAATVGVRATAAGGAVAFTLDGKRVALDAAAPYAASVDVSRLADGAHVLSAQLCDVTGAVCDTAHPAVSRAIWIKRLHPVLRSAGPTPFSPNGDKRRDTLTLAYTLDSAQDVAVLITNARGQRVLAKRLGTALAKGSHSWVWDGRTGTGAVAASGSYTVAIATTRRLPSGLVLSGLSTRTVVVDTARPGLGSLAWNASTVYPVVDGYRDSLTVRAVTSEPVARVELRVYSARGTLVRTVATGARSSAGPVTLTWNGRAASGRMAAAGVYGFRLGSFDLAGNELITAKRQVSVSLKRLAVRSASRTVDAFASVRARYVGACSLLAHPGRAAWAGSVGYYSAYSCPGTNPGDDLAAVEHQLTLPAAVRYGTVRVSAYGGAAVAGYSDMAGLVYVDRTGATTSTGRLLGPADGWYVGPTVDAAKYLVGGRTVRWVTGTVDTDWYDVRSYTVRWTYYVLV